MRFPSGVDTDGRAVVERVVPAYPAYDMWVDPFEGGQTNANWAYTILKRFVFLVAVLNVFVLAGLLVFHPGSSDDATAAVSGDESAAPDEPVATSDSVDAAVEFEVADDSTADPTPIADDGAQTTGGPLPVDTQDVSVNAVYPPPYPDPFEPTANEVQADAKRMGTMAAYAITNYEADSSLSDVVATLPRLDPDFAGATVLQVQSVHHPSMWSRGTVEYAQLGGHLDGRISIIVVIRQELGLVGSGDPERIETRTMEVRLARSESGAWGLETIASAGGQPLDRPADLSPLAAAVVDHELIDLPDTGVWDIYAGYIDEQLFQVMLDIAERTPYSVVVLQTGHSYNVFGTNRVSNHSVGKAVDIYKLESELVIDAHDPSSEFYALSEWVVSRYDIKEFGSPWRFPDAVAHTFTNQVHHDHLHIGVYPYPTSPNPPPEPAAVLSDSE